DRSIWAVAGRVNVSFHTYTDVHIRDFVRGLLRAPLHRHKEKVRYCDNLPRQPAETKRRLRVTDVLHEVNRFLRGRRGYMVVAAAAGLESFVVIEAIVRPDDLSPVSRKYIETSARRGQVAS